MIFFNFMRFYVFCFTTGSVKIAATPMFVTGGCLVP